MNFNNIDLIELVECYAEENNLIASEQELSDKFDEEVMPELLKAWHNDERNQGRTFEDQCLVDESFNNWADMLCKEGEIHDAQYSQYCNVGEYAYI